MLPSLKLESVLKWSKMQSWWIPTSTCSYINQILNFHKTPLVIKNYFYFLNTGSRIDKTPYKPPPLLLNVYKYGSRKKKKKKNKRHMCLFIPAKETKRRIILHRLSSYHFFFFAGHRINYSCCQYFRRQVRPLS